MDCFQLLEEVASWAVLASEVAIRQEAGLLAWVDQLEQVTEHPFASEVADLLELVLAVLKEQVVARPPLPLGLLDNHSQPVGEANLATSLEPHRIVAIVTFEQQPFRPGLHQMDLQCLLQQSVGRRGVGPLEMFRMWTHDELLPRSGSQC